MIRKIASRALRLSALLLALSFPMRVFAGELVYSQLADGRSVFGPSSRTPSGSSNAEVADDINLSGVIGRIVMQGYIQGTVSGFQGVYVRFYAVGADGKPAALQSETYLAAGDPGLIPDLYPNGWLDITLPAPFTATGRHFVSVQPVADFSWYPWSAESGAPRGDSFFYRDPAAGIAAWQKTDPPFSDTNADIAFMLYGSVSGPGTITSLSAASLPRSGFLEIFGSNFGGSGVVSIDGASAPVADWTSTRIVAYVPESARLGPVAVQVVNESGQASNVSNLTVTARESSGRVQWRFRMDGPYSQVRPALGPDRTIYAVDVFGHLYALAPDGGLKWLVRAAGEKGLAVGADGSIYVGSEDAIRAFRPDGTPRWTFTQNPRAFSLLGIGLGPDGNIYGVATSGIGVFSLTPAGALRWQTPEPYSRPIVDYGEIAFGANGARNQMYFYANNHLRALGLDGSSVFSIPGSQPVVAPDASVHLSLGAYRPSGSLLWSFASPYPSNVFTPPTLGSDGVHYFVQNLSQLFALGSGGSPLWHATFTDYVSSPIVDPTNVQLVMGSGGTLDRAGFIVSASAKDGQELWRVTLPKEDPTVFNAMLGIYGFNQFVDTPARFSPDGQTAYLVTATATGDNFTSKSFLYAIGAGVAAPPPPPPPPATTVTLRSTAIALTGKRSGSSVTASGAVSVKDSSGIAAAGALVAATWTLPGGSKVSQTGTTDSAGTAKFNAKGTRGTYTLTVANVTKTGAVFDKAGSVLSKTASY